MFWNQAGQFAGNSTSYVTVPNSISLNITGSFSIEAWVNPANTSNKGIISKGGTSLKYAVRITSSRVSFITNGTPRLSSKSTSLIPVNTWTHISATYNSSNNEFKIFINGQLDTSSIIASAAPTTNSDSLFIGISGASAPFNGQLDEVRLWNRDLSSTEVSQYYKTTLGTSSGIYSGLVLSMTFQKESSSGTKFSPNDFSGNGNNGNVRNVTARDLSFRPQHTISQNECVELDGSEDYLAAKDTATINPSTGITLECWIFPRAGGNYNIITKGNSYSIYYESNIVRARINGTSMSSNQSLPINRWSHIAFTYNSTNFAFYINFQTPTRVFLNLGSVSSNNDSLYVGGAPGSIGDLNGFIDEVRICDYAKSFTEVDRSIYNSIDAANDPNLAGIDISYNLDGYTLDNSENGGPGLFFRNNARFSHPAAVAGQPVSPVNRNSTNDLTEGFYMSTVVPRIPPTGSSGTLTSFSAVGLNSINITDINLFIALNHTNSSNLDIILTNPSGDSVKVFDNNTSNSLDNNIITVFDDQADSSLVNGRYSSFYTKVKPLNNMNSIFSGDNPFGTWKLTVRDEAANDTGFLYAWGIQFNNQSIREKDLDGAAYLQGFYDPSANLTVQDTMIIYLREFVSPYAIVDSSKRFFGLSGNAVYSFANTLNDHRYFIQLKHRNSIETWSSTGLSFRNSEGFYNFSGAASLAFGGNQIQVDNSPVRFAIFGGDVNQDGVVDATDAGAIDNDAFSFITGYVNTDLTGDDVVDASDAAIADNNAFNFVTAITP